MGYLSTFESSCYSLPIIVPPGGGLAFLQLQKALVAGMSRLLDHTERVVLTRALLKQAAPMNALAGKLFGHGPGWALLKLD